MTSKEESNQMHESSDDGDSPVCGERLAQARRNHDIAIREIAKELHLDETKVRALEENCFCLLYTSPSPRDGLLARMPSSA